MHRVCSDGIVRIVRDRHKISAGPSHAEVAQSTAKICIATDESRSRDGEAAPNSRTFKHQPFHLTRYHNTSYSQRVVAKHHTPIVSSPSIVPSPGYRLIGTVTAETCDGDELPTPKRWSKIKRYGPPSSWRRAHQLLPANVKDIDGASWGSWRGCGFVALR